ncbi:glycosyltransferase family 2 protein [Kineococcus esterisolvens]|uniref:glycosyltransferase family 2 protein n=1 Tax=unclassified Kineococcus TaxID=2621656 RepID=UPI003D7D477A
MTLLVLGDGAEGVRDELGRLVARLVTAGHDVVGLDVHAAEVTSRQDRAPDVLTWVLTSLGPRLVVWVDAPQPLPAVGADTTVLAADRAAVLPALRSLCGVATLPADAPSEAVHLAEALSAWRSAVQTGPRRLAVRERAPRVSVLMAFYNLSDYTHEAMRSALDQTYDDHEVVALDDGSTDETPDILASYAGNPRVRIVRQDNLGGTGRMDLVCNQLVRAARGELIAWAGGDDRNLPDRLQTQVGAFDDDPGLDVCHGAAILMDAAGTPLSRGWALPRPYDDHCLLRELVRQNLLGHPSVMMRRDAFQRSGLFEQGVSADYHFWLKTAGTLRYRYLPQPVVAYRFHEKSLSTSEAGAAHTYREGLRLRELVLRQRPLEDFFPELVGVDDRGIRADASLVLGNWLLDVSPELALLAWEGALALGSAGAHHNAAVVHWLTGDTAAAISSARAGVRIDPSVETLLDRFSAGGEEQFTLRGPGLALDEQLQRARRANGATIHRWDGTTLDVDSAYLALHPDHDELSREAIAAWCATTRAGDPVRWVIPSLGTAPEELFERLARLTAGSDLAAAADVTLELIDDLRMLPPSFDEARMLPSGAGHRLQGVVSSPSAVGALASWALTRASGYQTTS